jgi:hypothetical protein
MSLKRKVDTATKLSLLPIIRQSLLVHQIWKRLQNHWSQKIAETSLDIVKSYDNRPKFFDLDDDAILSHAARQWGKYHKLIHHLAAIDGVLSIHLLQPNPFVPGSKSLTPDENYRITNSFPIREYVVNGYPKLQAEIANLRPQGLIIDDLTAVFKPIETSVWNDSAHVNELGSRVIADKIVNLIKVNKTLISSSGASEQRSVMIQTTGKLSR